jgi:hypothetical protein
MATALEKRIEIDCGVSAAKLRQRCYAERRKFQANGDFRFDYLKFRIIGTTLVIFKDELEEKLQGVDKWF